MGLPSMHPILDTAEALALDSHGGDPAARERVMAALYPPDPVVRTVDGKPVLEPPVWWSEAQMRANAAAAGGAR
jgi:hypothetical protein